MSQEGNTGKDLAAVNSAVMGAVMPEVVLPDGQKVQTGTVGALIINIKRYDALMGQTEVDNKRKEELEAMMAAALPVLKMAGRSRRPPSLLLILGRVTRRQTFSRCSRPKNGFKGQALAGAMSGSLLFGMSSLDTDPINLTCSSSFLPPPPFFFCILVLPWPALLNI